MNKAELIEALSARAELSKAQAASAIDGLVDIITAAITKGESVALIGFDTFKSVMRVAREGRDMASGEKLKKAAAKFSKLSGGDILKAVLVSKKAEEEKETEKPAAAKPAAAKPAAVKPAAVKPAAAKPAAAKPAAAKPAAAKPAAAKPAAVKPAAAKPAAVKPAAAKPAAARPAAAEPAAK